MKGAIGGQKGTKETMGGQDIFINEFRIVNL